MSVRHALCIALLAWTVGLSPLGAQEALVFKVRLSTIPVEAATVTGLTGSGSATASLEGNQLTVTGMFDGLQSPATSAKLHVAPRGLRGPAMLDVDVTSGTSGKISGNLTLTEVQADHIQRGRVYLQVQSEDAPEGNLRGWLVR